MRSPGARARLLRPARRRAISGRRDVPVGWREQVADLAALRRIGASSGSRWRGYSWAVSSGPVRARASGPGGTVGARGSPAPTWRAAREQFEPRSPGAVWIRFSGGAPPAASDAPRTGPRRSSSASSSCRSPPFLPSVQGPRSHAVPRDRTYQQEVWQSLRLRPPPAAAGARGNPDPHHSLGRIRSRSRPRRERQPRCSAHDPPRPRCGRVPYVEGIRHVPDGGGRLSLTPVRPLHSGTTARPCQFSYLPPCASTPSISFLRTADAPSSGVRAALERLVQRRGHDAFS